MSVRVPRPLLILPLAILAGCASSGAPRSGKATPEVNALYDRMNQASKGYEASIDQARRGDTPAAAQTRKQALDQLKDASARCALTPGCDQQRFAAVFDRLLRLKDGSFIEGEDADEAEQGSEAGEQAGDVAGSVAVGTLPQAQRAVTMLKGQQFSDLMVMNGPVKAALEMWLTQLRPNLMDAYVNYQMMRYKMWPAYKKADLPEALLFGIMAKESGGKVHAVSRSGASGPLQFMYATGLRFGLSNTDGFDQRFDPTMAAQANAEYIDEQLRAFNNNLELTLAAYNGGEGRMRRIAATSPGASFYDPQIYGQMSAETRDYVPMVLAAAWLFLHPDSYHLTWPKIDGEPGQIVLKRPASISELTVCLGSAQGMPEGWFRTLRNLNPRLDPQISQPVGARLEVPKQLEKAYAATCTDGPWPILASDLHNAVKIVAPPPPAATSAALANGPSAPSSKPSSTASRNYTVRRGDTLVSIARKSSCADVEDIARMNRLKGHQLRVGQAIRVPVCR
ncbi:membrane-bound lytic murein transglycosylase D [Luteibacter jiangsuensis]|uniref:Membrane-bound lytic murein transglycosylase D n=1 Tax=Luteibacter jiangsuensis TaxID=637577 RepID=A0ABT9SUK2_9GAMM|nr:transglycosylase SLT domain-containing protein [Luteibacter jiangsuensis]MDQ0008674.1 membrane-bound lytic murein transglycosylase D [Luteibacter jiangsuensis]